MKKSIAVVCVLLAIICIAVIAVLVSIAPADDKATVFPVDFITPDGYGGIFGNVNEPSSSQASNDTATVTYDLTVSDSDPLKGYVTAQINLSINGKSCSCSASGEIEAMELTGDKYWDGPLRGDLYVDGTKYEDIFVHFNKLDSRNDIRMTLSISSENGSASLTFGTLLLDEQTLSEVESHRNYGA